MVIDTKNKILYCNKEKYELTDLQYKLLVALSNNKLTKTKKIAKYLFNSSTDVYINRIPVIKRNLKLKIKTNELRIKKKLDGYILKTDISFT